MAEYDDAVPEQVLPKLLAYVPQREVIRRTVPSGSRHLADHYLPDLLPVYSRRSPLLASTAPSQSGEGALPHLEGPYWVAVTYPECWSLTMYQDYWTPM